MPQQGKAGRYHHGDLRTALIDAAVSLIAERGVRGFSLAEASRRVGVSSAAPYRHFADRDDLLAAVGVRALETFASMVAEEGKAEPARRELDPVVGPAPLTQHVVGALQIVLADGVGTSEVFVELSVHGIDALVEGLLADLFVPAPDQ